MDPRGIPRPGAPSKMAHRNLQKGDVVLIQDSNEVRGKWKMGLVEEGINSLDGKVRRVKISYRTTEDGSRRVIERPVQRLILLAAVEDTSVEGECSDSLLTSTLHPTDPNITQNITESSSACKRLQTTTTATANRSRTPKSAKSRTTSERPVNNNKCNNDK